MATPLRILTWNIHKGIGTDRVYRLERVIQVLQAADADVVCLQEVDRGVRRSAFEDQAERLAREGGYDHAALGLNVRVRGGAYGNLTLSRFPLDDVCNVDLTIRPKKRRSGLVTRIRTAPPRGWLVANVHLGLMHLERRVQFRRLLGHLFDGAVAGDRLVIAGDWNDWRSRLVRPVMEEWGLHLAHEAERPGGETTWPSRHPLAALDKVVYRDPIRCLGVTSVRDPATRVTSDHLPLIVDLEAPEAGEAL